MSWQPKKTENQRWLALSRTGFGLALFVILLLGIGLAGTLTFARDWLETHWHLTFPTPLAEFFWLILALIPLLVILLYFLKLRRKVLQVPSTFLWRKSVEDLHVNSLLQWLKRNLLLILQLLFLLFVGYALAAPTYNSEAKGRHFIYLVDNSASMSATDVKPNRLEEAKTRLRKQIEALDPSDQAMLIVFNQEAQIMQSFTNRKEELLQAVGRILPTQRKTKIEQALVLAEGQANPRRSSIEGSIEDPRGQMARSLAPAEGLQAEVVIFSDGRFDDLPDFQLGRLRARMELIGDPKANNVGITSVGLRRDEARADQYEVAVRIQNFMERPLPHQVAVRLEVIAGGARLDQQVKPAPMAGRTRREMTRSDHLPSKALFVPGDSQPEPMISFLIKDPGQGYLRLTLTDAATGADWKDDFELDNQAWLAITPVRRARVLWIGPENEILDAFFKASLERQKLVLSRLAPIDFEKNPLYQEAVRTNRFDLVVFDRVQPGKIEEMPEANTFFIGAAPPWTGGNWSDLPTIKGAFVKEFRTAHPLMRGIDTLQGMNVGQCKALPKEALGQRASALIETQLEPIAWLLGRDRFADLILTFPLVVEDGGRMVWNTNWPKQPAGTLPLFLDNLLMQLGRFKEYEPPTPPGQPRTFDPGVPVTQALVQRREPTESNSIEVKRASRQELIYNAPEAVGLYEVAWGEKEPYRFAVNLQDMKESTLEPREDLLLGEELVSTQQVPIQARRELWPWLVLAAFVFLLLEWIVYQRRVSV